MEHFRTITYRIYTKPAKCRALEKHGHACRFVWNHFVAKTRADYDKWKASGDDALKPSVSFFTLGTQFTKLRKSEPWLHELSANNVKGVLKDLHIAYQRFFKNPGPDGPPRFKSVHRHPLSFPLASRDTFKIQGSWLHIQKIGQVCLSGSNPYPNGVPVAGRVTEKGGKWFARIQCKAGEADLKESGLIEDAVGIDRNVGQVACSDGSMFHLPDMTRLEAKRRRHQRAMARRQRGSKRYEKAKRRAANVSRKIANRRKDWSRQTTRRIANKYGTAVLEDLKVNSMSKSAKGTAETPGTNVSQKRGLNRSIAKSAWAVFDNTLACKASNPIKVNPACTSQTCSVCGSVDSKSRKSQSVFKCVACGHRANADINAALNILASGTGASARGGGDAGRPVKRESVYEIRAA